MPDRQAVVMLAEPVIEGERTEVGVELWCGMVCAIGPTRVVERTESGEWIVTVNTDGPPTGP
jgi:hypothetical protein